MSIMKNIFKSLEELFRDKSEDIKDAQSYRDEEGNIVDDFSKQEHINMVDSSAINNVKYDKNTGDATVTFKTSNKEYVYPNVPENVIKHWHMAPSKGRYFHRNVKQYSTNK